MVSYLLVNSHKKFAKVTVQSNGYEKLKHQCNNSLAHNYWHTRIKTVKSTWTEYWIRIYLLIFLEQKVMPKIYILWAIVHIWDCNGNQRHVLTKILCRLGIQDSKFFCLFLELWNFVVNFITHVFLYWKRK